MEHEFWHTRWAKGEIGFHEGSVNKYLHDHWPEFAGDRTDAVFVPFVARPMICGGYTIGDTRLLGSNSVTLPARTSSRKQRKKQRFTPGSRLPDFAMTTWNSGAATSFSWCQKT